MKPVLLFITFFLFMHTAHAGDKYLFETEQNGLVKLLAVGKNNYLVTASHIYKIGGKRLEPQAKFPFTCADACVYQDGFALATDSGLVHYSVRHGRLKKLLQLPFSKPVNNVLLDAQKRLWFSMPYEGAFLYEGSQAHQKVHVPRLYALAATPDSTVWAGTNLGLYKVPATGTGILRYTEEGIEGAELPDNLVERLFADEASNVWALMPDNLAFIQGKNNDGHVAAYVYPGGNDNPVFSIAKLPISATSFLFATQQGLIFAQALKGMHAVHSGEIHQAYQETSYLVSDAMMQRPAELAGVPVLSVSNLGNHTWFVTARGIWSTTTKRLLKRLSATTS
jgi:ligand-binding sensor domain-containing protein